jgi:predicted CoA-binding protein
MADPRTVLEQASTVAVVGMSADQGKPAGSVPAELAQHGFDVIPVHPKAAEILGRRAYARLADVPGPVDVVEVFRPAEEAPDIASQAVAIGAKALWLQLGITSAEARAIAEGAGLDYVEDHCMRAERRRFGIEKP